jgi:hypothetical protein
MIKKALPACGIYHFGEEEEEWVDPFSDPEVDLFIYPRDPDCISCGFFPSRCGFGIG